MGGRGASSRTSRATALARQKAKSEGGSLSIEDAAKVTNPHFREGRAYQSNCQRCVIAYEMNRRGIRCEARGRRFGIRADDAAYNWYHLMEGQTWDRVGSMSEPKTIDNIEQAMRNYGDGSRAVICVTWKGGRSSHVFNVENVGGKMRYIDAQSGNANVSIKSYIDGAMPAKTLISRVDNLKPNEKYIDDVIRRK